MCAYSEALFNLLGALRLHITDLSLMRFRIGLLLVFLTLEFVSIIQFLKYNLLNSVVFIDPIFNLVFRIFRQTFN